MTAQRLTCVQLLRQFVT